LIALVDTLTKKLQHTPRAVIEFSDYNYLQQHGEHLEEHDLDEDVMLDELLVEGQLKTPIVPMVEKNGQSSVGRDIDEEKIDA